MCHCGLRKQGLVVFIMHKTFPWYCTVRFLRCIQRSNHIWIRSDLEAPWSTFKCKTFQGGRVMAECYLSLTHPFSETMVACSSDRTLRAGRRSNTARLTVHSSVPPTGRKSSRTYIWTVPSEGFVMRWTRHACYFIFAFIFGDVLLLKGQIMQLLPLPLYVHT